MESPHIIHILSEISDRLAALNVRMDLRLNASKHASICTRECVYVCAHMHSCLCAGVHEFVAGEVHLSL
jgi:hypothetical protein